MIRKSMTILVLAVLGMASSTDAAVLLSVNGVVDPLDTEIVLEPSDTVTIDIWGDGQTAAPVDCYLIVQGPGTIAGHTMLYPGALSAYQDLEEISANTGMTPQEILDLLASDFGFAGANDLSEITFLDSAPTQPPLVGTLLDDVIFHCEGYQDPSYPGGAPGDVLLTLISSDFATVYDTQIIHQVPEPMTMSLLVLGGVALLRRRRT